MRPNHLTRLPLACLLLALTTMWWGCPNGCNWPEDECQTWEGCAEGESCVWSGNNGVGGYNYCIAPCATDATGMCDRELCDPGRQWTFMGHPCVNPGDDPTWESVDATGTVTSSGAYFESGMAALDDLNGCACPRPIIDGTWFVYDDQGQPLSEIGYDRGTLHGPSRSWYPGGQMRLEWHYDSGRLHGPHTAWYPNGQLEYEGQYEHNQGAGTWRYYYSDGSLRGEKHYNNGTLTDESYWDENGDPVESLPPKSED